MCKYLHTSNICPIDVASHVYYSGIHSDVLLIIVVVMPWPLMRNSYTI